MFFNLLLKSPPGRRPGAAPGDSRHPSPQRSPWFKSAVILLCIGAVAWALFSQRYYAWSLSNERINLVVFCDTAELNNPDLQVFVLYDQMALNPLVRALGLYQNRPPESVKVFFPLPVRNYTLTPFSVTLPDVPWGPVSRVAFIVQGRQFNVNVPDRRLVKGTLYIRAPA